MNTKSSNTTEIDVLYLIKKIWSSKFLISLIAVLGATISLLVSLFLITPEYTSTTRIYVVNQNPSEGANITTQELQAGSYLVKDYKEIITSNDVLTKVIDKGNRNEDVKELLKKISVATPTDTRVISISVKDKNNGEASKLANLVREVSSDKIKSVMKVKDVTTLEIAEPSAEPSSPNIKRNVFLGVIVGTALAVLAVLMGEVLDDRVKRPEDIEEVLGMTLLGVVPDTDKL